MTQTILTTIGFTMDDNNSEEYNTIMAFADDLDSIGVHALTTNQIRNYAAAAEAHTTTKVMGLDDMNTIEDFNL